MITPFGISQVDTQDYADRERWQYECQPFGVDKDQLIAYEYSALRYAATTVYANHLVVAYARRLAKEALMRGEPLPVNAEQAIENENTRRLVRLLNRP